MLISVSAVAAADNSTQIINTKNSNDNFLTVDNKEKLTDESYGSFADLNKTINGNSSTNIVLDRDYTYSSSDRIKEGIVINKDNITIDGQGHTIDAKNQSRIFYVNSTTVYLKNIVFTNGYSASNGGAIFSDGNNLRIINCTFISNAAEFGGAVYSYPDNLDVFQNSNFVANKADCGGAVYLMYGIRHYVFNCTFESNQATDYGGAIAIYGIQGHTERPYSDSLTVDGSKFLYNKAKYGDAISNPHSACLNITNSVLLGNVENLIDNDVYFAYANYNWFGNTYNNKSVRPNLHKSIGLDNWLYFDLIPNLDTSRATISINNLYNAKTGETGIYSTSKLPLMNVDVNTTNATINSNNITLDNAGQYELEFVLLGNSVLIANCENIEVSKNIKIGGLRELENLIKNTPDNSVITLDKDYVYVPGVDAINHPIYINDKHNIVIDAKGHTVSGVGKTLLFMVDKDSSSITFKNMNIVDAYNDDSNGGSAAYILADHTMFINCTFYNNDAAYETGGALHLGAADCSIIDCRFINNTDEISSGAAIVQRGGSVYIANTLFENNTASNTGGALRLGGSAVIDNCTFRYNSAAGGGAIFFYDGVTISNSTFIGNKALDDTYTTGGGAIHGGSGNIVNSIFIDNEAMFGAAVYMTSSSSRIDKSIFINNTGAGGGIIYSTAKGGTVSNSIFLNNDVGYYYHVISSLNESLKADYNWFGNTGMNYANVPPVTNLAIMTKWIFLNATNPVYNDKTNEFTTQFDFYVYDDVTKNIVKYDFEDMPAVELTLIGHNLTLDENRVLIGNTIDGITTYYKGNLIAQYENVKYVLPFNHKIKSWIDADTIIEVSKDGTITIQPTVEPIGSEASLFLISNGRLTVTSNDTSIVKVTKKNYSYQLTGVNLGLAEITIKFDGKNTIGEDRYLPSNATILVNVTKVRTQIVNITSLPTEVVEVGDGANVILGVRDSKGKSIKGTVTYEYTNNNPDVLDIKGTYANNFVYKVIGEGMANVTVYFPGNENCLPCSRDITFKTGRKDANLQLSDYNLTLERDSFYWIGIFTNSNEELDLTFSSNNTNVATIVYDNGHYEVRGINGGIANITIQFNGDSKYKPDVAYLYVFVDDGATYIDVNTTMECFVTDTVGINPILRDKQGKHIGGTFTFSSNDTEVVDIDEYGVFVANKVGKANVTIEYPGNQKYMPSKVNIIVTVTTDINEINVVSAVDVSVDQRVNLNATLPRGGKLTYSSNDTSVVSVDSRGYITAHKVGTANITVTYSGTEKYDSDVEYVMVTVSRAVTSINVEKSFAWEIGESGNIAATLKPQYAGNLNFISNNESVVKVDKRGVITTVGVGKTTILISFDGNDKYMPVNETVDVTVYSDYISTSIEVNKTFDLYVGDTVDIGAVLNPSNAGKLNYISSNEKIVKIDENGKVTAIGQGKTTIKIDFAGQNKFLPNSTQVTVTVSLIPTTVEASSLTVNLTEGINLNYTFNHPEAGDLKFDFEDITIAHIENGKVIGDKVGKTKLTISFNGDAKYKHSNVTVDITVTDVETSIDVEDTVEVKVSKDKLIVASLKPVEAGKLTFKTNDNNIISIDSMGYVYGIRAGTATVTVTYDGTGTKYRSVNKTVNVVVSNIETSIDSIDSIDVNMTETGMIVATLNPQNAGILKFSSNDTSIVTVDNKGKIKGIKVGTAIVTITFEDKNGVYSSSSKNVTVNVKDVETEIAVEKGNINLVYGDENKVNASINPNVGNLVYSSNDTDVITVDDEGNIKTVKPGIATITVSYAGQGKYRSSNKTLTVNVARAPTSIEIDDTIKMEIGILSELKPVLNPKFAGNLMFTTNDTDIIEISGNGKIFSLSSGTATVKVSFEGNEYYLPSNATVKIVIGARETEIDVNDSVVIGFSESMDLGAVLRTSLSGHTLDYKIHFVSSNPDVVTVYDNGTITANKIGNAVITITFDGERLYKPSNATVNVEVTTKTTTVKVDSTSKTLRVDDTDSIKAVLIHGPEIHNLNYVSDHPEIVMVNPFTGEITARSQGKAKITVSYAGDDEYHASSATVDVTVSKYTTHVVADTSYSLTVFDKLDLNASVTPNGAALKYVSSNPDVVTVNQYGVMEAKKSGNATINIKFEGDRKYLPSEKTVIVSVSKVPTSIDVGNIYLYSGDEYDLGRVLLPVDAPASSKYLTFASDDWDVFDVDSKGIITAFHEGSAELSIEFKGNDIYLPSHAFVKVFVHKRTLSQDDCKFNIEVSDDSGEAKFTLTVPENAEGSFIVIVDGAPYGESIENGFATVDVSDLEPGDHKVVMRYTGDEKYVSITNNTVIHIYKIKIDKNKNVAVTCVERAVYSVHLTRDTQAMEGKTVIFKVNGKKYTAVTNRNGYAKIKLPKLPAKSYRITASYKNISVANKIVSKHVVVAKNLKAKKTKALKVKVTLNKVNKKYLSSKKVTLKFNGKKYTAKTNKKGVATFTIAKKVLSKLKVGKSYKYKVAYSKDSVTKKIKITK